MSECSVLSGHCNALSVPFQVQRKVMNWEKERLKLKGNLKTCVSRYPDLEPIMQQAEGIVYFDGEAIMGKASG